MNIADIMTHNATVIRPDATVREACEKMRDEDIGFLPVCDGDTVLGTVTDRDIATRAIADSANLENRLVSDIMTKELVFVYDDQEILEAARLMEVKQVRRLVVINRNKKLVGVLSLGDLSRQSTDQHLAVEVLERVSEPAWQQIGL